MSNPPLHLLGPIIYQQLVESTSSEHAECTNVQMLSGWTMCERARTKWHAVDCSPQSADRDDRAAFQLALIQMMNMINRNSDAWREAFWMVAGWEGRLRTPVEKAEDLGRPAGKAYRCVRLERLHSLRLTEDLALQIAAGDSEVLLIQFLTIPRDP